MNTSDYRQEYAAFCRAREEALYELYLETSSSPSLPEIFDRHSDLCTQEAVAGLRRLRADTPTQFATERDGLERLTDAACEQFIAGASFESGDELRRCEATSHIRFQGKILAASEAPKAITTESNAKTRAELFARWLDELPPCDELRIARYHSMSEAARLLDDDNGTGLNNADETIKEALSGTSVADLVAFAVAYLDRTASVYRAHLSANLKETIADVAFDGLTYADALRFEFLPQLVKYFPASDLTATYRLTMNSFSINTENQKSLSVHRREQSKLAASSRQTMPPARRGFIEEHAATFGIDPPQTVHLVWDESANGAAVYETFLEQAARAQHLAATSQELRTRQPEFAFDLRDADGRRCDAIRAGFARLFAELLHDGQWVSEHRRVRREEADGVARLCAFVALYRARRCCARVVLQSELRHQSDLANEDLKRDYAAQMSEATGFRYDSRLHLYDLLGGDDARTELRGRLFAVTLREHLRTRYGSRWWATSGARDELFDMWSTGARYTPEQLVKSVAGAVLDIEMLIEASVAAAFADGNTN